MSLLTKEQILDEVRRTAQENGGQPLGQARFRHATDIGPYEWGKYWAKFGDMVSEAGLSPNKPWSYVPDEVLVKQMIILIRDLGRYPTIPEMRIRQLQNSEFPYTIIKKRTKPFVVNKIVEYCKNNEAYSDIIEICQPLLDDLTQDKSSITHIIGKEFGEVYLVKSGNYYKIGKTNNIVRRGSELQIQLPEKIELIHSIVTDDPSGIESYWHKRFEQKRMKGEWFNLKPEDIMAFRRWRKIS